MSILNSLNCSLLLPFSFKRRGNFKKSGLLTRSREFHVFLKISWPQTIEDFTLNCFEARDILKSRLHHSWVQSLCESELSHQVISNFKRTWLRSFLLRDITFHAIWIWRPMNLFQIPSNWKKIWGRWILIIFCRLSAHNFELSYLLIQLPFRLRLLVDKYLFSF